MNAIESTRTIPTAEALEHQLRQHGYQPGVPPRIDAATRAVDARVCRRMRCPGCRKRRMVYRPFSNGQAYRVLACCQNCPAAEEV